MPQRSPLEKQRKTFLLSPSSFSFGELLYHNWDACDARIGKDVAFIATFRGELADDRAIRSGLEPVVRVGMHRVLVAFVQDDLVAPIG